MIHEFDESPNPWPMRYPDMRLPAGVITLEDECLLRDYGNGLTVDLGTHRGRSAAILSLRADRVYTIDRYLMRDDIKEYSHAHSIENLKHFKNVTSMCARSESIPIEIKKGSVDVLFVDAGHKYKEVSDDFNSWYDYVKDCGYIIFHDYLLQNPDDEMLLRDVQVKKFVDEILKKEIVKRVEQTGLCMVVQK